jgi:steroid delta-isomerase-like uncharacterized protein
MSVEATREVLDRYFAADHDDVSMMADDVTFTIMGTGQAHVGPAAIAGMLHWFYHVAFEATAEPRNLVIGDGHAFGEWDLVGRHTGEFAGVPATGKEVRVPLAVAYDVENGRLTRGRVYFETPVFLAQVGALEATAPA